MPLTDTAVRNAKPGSKPVKLSDGGGLHLLIQPHGTKLWRMAYRHAGKQKTLALGIYPTVSLADARSRRDEAKKLLSEGVDPSVHRGLKSRPSRSTSSWWPTSFWRRCVAKEGQLRRCRRRSGCWSLLFRHSVRGRSPRSRLSKFLMCCARLKRARNMRRQGDCVALAAWCSGTRLPPVERNVIRPSTYGVR